MSAPLTASSSRFALALLSLDGVGRVTAHRLIERFPTLDALRATPREQVLLRLKGAPNAERTVETLFSPEAFAPALERADALVQSLVSKGIRVLAPADRAWPGGLDALPRESRPVLLYAYGKIPALNRPRLSFLTHAPVEGTVFEATQALARDAMARGVGLVVGARHGVDLALQKLAVGAGVPVVAVVGSGLARLERSMRPGATALVRAGGLLLSPFSMAHGPFDHDDRERALVQAALGAAVCAAAPPRGSSEDRAAAWAAETGRPLALIPPAPPDADWTADALRVDGPESFGAVASLAT